MTARIETDYVPEDWKPGDVAMVTALNRRVPYRAYYDGRYKTWREHGQTDFSVEIPTSIRPLAVIDPEDAEQVNRLVAAFGTGNLDTPIPSDMQAALREFAAPEPEEPTGLGAVVIDAEGADWHRSATGRWIAEDGLRTRAGGWGHVKAVRVVSQGVPE